MCSTFGFNNIMWNSQLQSDELFRFKASTDTEEHWNLEYVLICSSFNDARLREGVPYVKVCRYNPKHLCPKLNGYGDNGQRSLKL
jgi:hypothetical protein